MSAVNVLGNSAVSQPFRVTEAGAIGGPRGMRGSEGGLGLEIGTRSAGEEADRVSISPEGKRLAERAGSPEAGNQPDSKQSDSEGSPRSRFEQVTGAAKAHSEESSEKVPEGGAKEAAKTEEASSKTVGPDGEKELSTEDVEEVREMKRRDQEVRAHEMAHKRAAGSLATGGPVYEYETGPDGRQYAVGGHVSIVIPKGNSPAETIRIAQQAKRAALAPATPSGQDRSVAVEAQNRVQKAQKKMAQDQVEQFSVAKATINVPQEKPEKPEKVEENSKSSAEPSSQFNKETDDVSAWEPTSSVSPAIEAEPTEDAQSAKSKSATDAYNQINDFSDELALAGCNSCRILECRCPIA